MRTFLLYLVSFFAVALIILELFFQFVIPASENPLTEFDTAYNITIYDSTRGDEGLYTYGRLSEVKGEWKVNNYGWVSEVNFEQPGGNRKPMVALIGDSYVENLYCDVKDHLDRVMEKELGGEYVVYPFGTSGMNMSQFANVTRYVQERFKPDVIVYLVNHRNLRESLTTVLRRENQIQYKPVGEGIERVEPKPFKPSRMARILRYSALYRYFKTNFLFEIKLPDPTPWEKKVVKPLDYDNPTPEMVALMEKTCDTIISELEGLTRGTEVLFALHPNRPPIYAGIEPAPQTPDLTIVSRVLQKRGDAFVDLNTHFQETWKREHRSFEFPTNQHWDDYGQEVAGKGIVIALRNRLASQQQVASVAADSTVLSLP